MWYWAEKFILYNVLPRLLPKPYLVRLRGGLCAGEAIDISGSGILGAAVKPSTIALPSTTVPCCILFRSWSKLSFRLISNCRFRSGVNSHSSGNSNRCLGLWWRKSNGTSSKVSAGSFASFTSELTTSLRYRLFCICESNISQLILTISVDGL